MDQDLRYRTPPNTSGRSAPPPPPPPPPTGSSSGLGYHAASSSTAHSSQPPPYSIPSGSGEPAFASYADYLRSSHASYALPADTTNSSSASATPLPYGSSFSPLPKQPEGGGGSGGGPWFDNSSDATNQFMVNFGLQYGHKVLRRTHDNLSRYVFSVDGLRYYFSVNNSYVKNKLKLLLFPLLHKFRRREVDRHSHFEQQMMMMHVAAPPSSSISSSSAVSSGSGHHHYYLTALDDVNAPDLYIPLMSFITYIILYGLLRGILGRRFTPETLIATGSSSLVLVAAELLLLKLGIFLFVGSSKVTYLLELLCWTSYKYVNVCACLLFRLLVLHHPWVYYLFWVQMALFHGYFLFKTLQSNGVGGGGSSKVQQYGLLSVALSQVPIFLWLLHT